MAAVHGLDAISLIAAKPIRPTDQQRWTDWLVAHADSHGGELWRLLDPAPAGRPGAGHSHVVHLPTSSSADFDAATELARDAVGGGAAHVEIQRDGWRRAGDGLQTDSTTDVTGLIIAHVLCADPRRTDEWDAWYDQQHLPDMMGSDAFVAGSRWRRAEPRTGGANHLTIYEVAGISVGEAIERSAAVMPQLVAEGRKHDSHAGGLTWALERVR